MLSRCLVKPRNSCILWEEGKLPGCGASVSRRARKRRGLISAGSLAARPGAAGTQLSGAATREDPGSAASLKGRTVGDGVATAAHRLRAAGEAPRRRRHLLRESNPGRGGREEWDGGTGRGAAELQIWGASGALQGSSLPQLPAPVRASWHGHPGPGHLHALTHRAGTRICVRAHTSPCGCAVLCRLPYGVFESRHTNAAGTRTPGSRTPAALQDFGGEC